MGSSIWRDGPSPLCELAIEGLVSWNFAIIGAISSSPLRRSSRGTHLCFQVPNGLFPTRQVQNRYTIIKNEHRGALRGTPGSAYPQPEPNATELPSSAPGRPKLVEICKPPRLRRRRHAPRNTSPPRPRGNVSAGLNSSRFARKFSAFGAVRIPKPPRLRRRRHAPRNTSPPRPRPPPRAEENFARHRAADPVALCAESFSAFGAARPCRASRPRALARRRAPK